MMLQEKKRLLVFIVAYFAERTIEKVLRRIPASLNDDYDVEVLIIDDASKDETFAAGVTAQQSSDIPFKVTVLYNPENQGYGGNQKIGYNYAIRNGFDYVALLHGDGQYPPEMLGKLADCLRGGEADAVFGSRMMNPRDALKGGMPYYKFAGNRILTTAQNWLLDANLTEFHSGYRAYSVAALKQLPFERNANVFHFDTEIIIQLLMAGLRIKEIPIPTYYGDEICYVNGMKYAKDVMKASLQARLQKVNLFYDRRFDCAVKATGESYPSKLEFDSSHSRVLELVPTGSRVLDLGSGIGAVGNALKKKSCWVVGCDLAPGPLTRDYDRFFVADLNKGVPELPTERFDYILALDVIEHLNDPEEFLDQLRALSARTGGRVILSTANVAFILTRLSLLAGRFEYGKRGILDLTHTRLFTIRTLRRAMAAAGFDIQSSEGIVVPAPFVFGRGRLSSAVLAVNRFLARIMPGLFGFQVLVVAKGRPALDELLGAAVEAAETKMPSATAYAQRLKSA
jgi:glycosyltransferase involved in cell wall biosynthesis